MCNVIAVRQAKKSEKQTELNAKEIEELKKRQTNVEKRVGALEKTVKIWRRPKG